ncbi:Uncharacterised protein [uncultured Comamonas sp.]|nr:Uncharacterised protein [uncultured Comamonas sp.]
MRSTVKVAARWTVGEITLRTVAARAAFLAFAISARASVVLAETGTVVVKTALRAFPTFEAAFLRAFAIRTAEARAAICLAETAAFLALAVAARASVVLAEAGAVAVETALRAFTPFKPAFLRTFAIGTAEARATIRLTEATAFLAFAVAARASVVLAEARAVVVKAALRAFTAFKPAFLRAITIRTAEARAAIGLTETAAFLTFAIAARASVVFAEARAVVVKAALRALAAALETVAAALRTVGKIPLRAIAARAAFPFPARATLPLPPGARSRKIPVGGTRAGTGAGRRSWFGRRHGHLWAKEGGYCRCAALSLSALGQSAEAQTPMACACGEADLRLGNTPVRNASRSRTRTPPYSTWMAPAASSVVSASLTRWRDRPTR